MSGSEPEPTSRADGPRLRAVFLPLAGCRGLHARRIAERSSPGRHVTGDHAARADQRIITDGNARQDDRSRSDPDVAPDPDRATKLQAGGSPHRVARMVGRQDLHARPDLRAVADGDLHDIEVHAVEIREHPSTEANVEAVVAMDGGRITAPSPTAAKRLPVACAGRRGPCRVPRYSARATFASPPGLL